MQRTGQGVDAAQAGGIDAARRPGALTRGTVHGGGRRWRGQERQEETPSDSRLGAREGVAVDRVRRGGHRRPKKKPHPLAFEARGGVGGTRQGGAAGINKVSCKFHVTLFGCRVGGDVGQLSSPPVPNLTHPQSPLLLLHVHCHRATKRDNPTCSVSPPGPTRPSSIRSAMRASSTVFSRIPKMHCEYLNMALLSRDVNQGSIKK